MFRQIYYYWLLIQIEVFDMNILSVLIVVALLLTIAVLGTGIWSMAHGGEFDKKHSSQLMFARVGMQAVTLVFLFLAIYLANN
jgi:hypothetical protein